jgi:hypothetical protein
LRIQRRARRRGEKERRERKRGGRSIFLLVTDTDLAAVAISAGEAFAPFDCRRSLYKGEERREK